MLVNTMNKDTQDVPKTTTETKGKSAHHSPSEEKTGKTNSTQAIREGRKSLTMPKSYGGKSKVRYIEDTKALKDGCWLSDK